MTRYGNDDFLEDTCFSEPSIERGMTMEELHGKKEPVLSKEERFQIEEELRELADAIQELQIGQQRCLSRMVKIAKKIGIEIE